MPTISRFYGILIRMYYDDHGIPHFHAQYAEFKANYSVETLELVVGYLPTPQRKLVEAWAVLHQEELLENADRMDQELPPRKIAPLR
jgi:hypothetical protein